MKRLLKIGCVIFIQFFMTIMFLVCDFAYSQSVSDNYSVEESQGTYKPPPQPPPKKCRKVCSTKYYDCAVDCFRGSIFVMGGCLGKCSYEKCETVCE